MHKTSISDARELTKLREVTANREREMGHLRQTIARQNHQINLIARDRDKLRMQLRNVHMLLAEAKRRANITGPIVVPTPKERMHQQISASAPVTSKNAKLGSSVASADLKSAFDFAMRGSKALLRGGTPRNNATVGVGRGRGRGVVGAGTRGTARFCGRRGS